MEAIELGFDTLVRLCILLIELAGIIVIVISMVRGFIGFVQKDDSTRIQLAQGIMLGLEFKVGSEVLRSVIGGGHSVAQPAYPAPALGDRRGGKASARMQGGRSGRGREAARSLSAVR